MPFESANFGSIANAMVDGSRINVWVYKSDTDTLATCMAGGYFAAVGSTSGDSQTTVGDPIYIVASDGEAWARIGSATVGSAYTGGRQHLRIPIAFGDGTAENDTGVDLPATAIVHDVYVSCTTAETTGVTKTLSVGLLSSESGGDANGFLASVDVSATGIKRGVPTWTVGSNEDFFASTTRGVLLTDFTAGSDVATDTGNNNEQPHLTDSVTAKSVSWQPATGGDWAEFVGEIVVEYSV